MQVVENGVIYNSLYSEQSQLKKSSLWDIFSYFFTFLKKRYHVIAYQKIGMFLKTGAIHELCKLL